MSDELDTLANDPAVKAILDSHMKHLGQQDEPPAEDKPEDKAPPEEKPDDKPDEQVEDTAENKDHRDHGDEDEKQQEDEKPVGITPKMARLADRFLSTGFGIPDSALNRMTDEELAAEAVRRATETLKKAHIPDRVIGRMTDDEKIESAFEPRRQQLQQKREYEAAKKNAVDGRKPTTQPPPVEARGSEEADLADLGGVLELLDPKERALVEGKIKRLQEDRDRAMQEATTTQKYVAANNIAGAILDVGDEWQGFSTDHDAAYAAITEVADELGADLNKIALKGGDALLRLARLAAEKLGLERSTPTAKAERASSVKPKPPQTPPPPNTRGGRVVALTEEQKALAFAQAMIDSGGRVEEGLERFRRTVGP